MYLRLSNFYFWYFATLGALIPYWGLYLQSLGFAAGDIGELVAALMATKLVAPYLWGWLADHHGRPMYIVRGAALAALVAFSGVLWRQEFAWLMLVTVIFSFFWNAALPQFEAYTLNRLGPAVHRYSRVRLWGSVGFIVAVAGLGPVLQGWGAQLLPVVLVVLLGCLWLGTLALEDGPRPPSRQPAGAIGEVLRRREVQVLLLVCFLMQLSHGPYYTFYSIYLEAHGYGRSLIGQLWALGVIAEIVVFLFMHRLLPRFGVRRLLFASLLLTTLRWVLIAGFVNVLPVLAAAQLLHAASFGLYHAVAITLVHRYFRDRHQGRGQALYSSVSFGAGGAAGSLLSGYLWQGMGAEATYLSAAAVSAVALLLARALPIEKQE